MQDETKISKEELKSIVKECIQNNDKNNNKKWGIGTEVLKIVLTPLMIALVGLLGTWTITSKELKNAELLAAKQNINAQIIAQNQIEAAQIRSNAQQDLEMFSYILPIYNSILNDLEQYPENSTKMKNKLRSLEIYGHTSISFLMNLRDRFKDENGDLSNFIKSIILNVITFSQHDLSGYNIIGEEKNIINMRNVNLRNFEMSDSIFDYVNLYKANFNGSNLKNVRFENVDLVDADFSNSNLSGSIFIDADLNRTNFLNANLRGVKFENIDHIENAKFSLGSLLQANVTPFRNISREIYLLLLVDHIENLKKAFNRDPWTLNDLLRKMELSFSDLISSLERERQRRLNTE